jgi:hypothetical protein
MWRTVSFIPRQTSSENSYDYYVKLNLATLAFCVSKKDVIYKQKGNSETRNKK